jgi:DNA-binding CsgD family transcriptional regulator
MHTEEKREHLKEVANIALFTKREIDVLKLICEECSTKQIAGALTISHHTVEAHKKNLRSKTGSFTLVGVALYAVKNNIFIRALAYILPSLYNAEFIDLFYPGMLA